MSGIVLDAEGAMMLCTQQLVCVTINRDKAPSWGGWEASERTGRLSWVPNDEWSVTRQRSGGKSWGTLSHSTERY